MSRIAYALAFVGLAAATAPGWDAAPTPARAASAAGPLAEHALDRGHQYRFDGDVAETLDAGSYAYLRVRTTAGDRWVVTLAATRPDSAQVRVRVVGEADNFHSPRLARDFDRLAFGVVSAR